MKNYMIKFGIIGGLVSSVLGTLNWFVIARPFGVSVSQTVGYLSIAVSLLCIPYGIRYFRDKLNGGAVSFGQAIKIGLGITSIAGIVMAIHSILFFALQKDAFMEWQKQDLTGEELAAFEAQLAQMPDFAYTPWFQGIVMFVMVFLIGLAINLVSAALLRRSA